MPEALDHGALLRVLESVLPGPLTVTRAVALTGGASADTHAVDVRDGGGTEHALIVRRTAGGESAGDPGVSKRVEALTQRAAAESGVPAAPVLALFDDPALGSGYVMERLAGETIPRKLLRDARFAAARSGLVGDCARALAAIHRVPRAALPELPSLSIAAQLATLEATHRSFGHAVPTFSLAFRFLRARLPAETEPVLVHGDFRTGNLLVDERGLVAVLDWELVHLGDPLEDLGWLCAAAWRFGGEGECGGFGSRAALHAAYAEASGRDVDPARAWFWEVFAALRWGVICEWQAFAHLRGATPSLERAAIGRRVTEVELDLLVAMEGPA